MILSFKCPWYKTKSALLVFLAKTNTGGLYEKVIKGYTDFDETNYPAFYWIDNYDDLIPVSNSDPADLFKAAQNSSETWW